MNVKIELNSYDYDCDVEWVNSELRLSNLAEYWKNKTFIAIDTEFERRTTFYAKLALVQIFDGDKIFLIDPLSTSCPESLREVLENPEITKIFHSCKEDLEVLYTSWNCKLKGLFDTQVAYSFLNSELSIGYAKLVEEFFHLPVDKKETTSNWIKRPLTDQQKNYAAKDVLYLLEIFNQQKQNLLDSRFEKLFKQECEELCLNAVESIDSHANYQDAKDVWRLNSKQTGLFKSLFEWRELIAREEDKTKNHIIKDHELVELSIIAPNEKSQIRSIKNLHPRSIRIYSTVWLKLISDWRANGEPLAETVQNPRDVSGLKSLTNKLEKVVKNIAEENQLNPTFLLSKRIIRKLAQAVITEKLEPPQWKGWRKKLLIEQVKNVELES